jgi:DNA-binding response OmpR family regulator
LDPVLSPRVDSTAGERRAAPPRLLRCLVVSGTAERRRLIRAAAERETWDAIVCRDAGEFLRAAFKRSVPLMIIDLPGEESPSYWALREATDRAKQISDALVAVTGAGASDGEELWARKLGAWSYLSEAFSQRGFEVLLSEARAALERRDQYRLDQFPLPLTPASAEDGW